MKAIEFCEWKIATSPVPVLTVCFANVQSNPFTRWFVCVACERMLDRSARNRGQISQKSHIISDPPAPLLADIPASPPAQASIKYHKFMTLLQMRNYAIGSVNSRVLCEFIHSQDDHSLSLRYSIRMCNRQTMRLCASSTQKHLNARAIAPHHKMKPNRKSATISYDRSAFCHGPATVARWTKGDGDAKAADEHKTIEHSINYKHKRNKCV